MSAEQEQEQERIFCIIKKTASSDTFNNRKGMCFRRAAGEHRVERCVVRGRLATSSRSEVAYFSRKKRVAKGLLVCKSND